MQLRAPLKKCSNGCDAPPKAPSWVLCADCMHKLREKMQRIVDEWPAPSSPARGSDVRGK
jgi:hypothetical protein